MKTFWYILDKVLIAALAVTWTSLVIAAVYMGVELANNL